MKKLYLFIFLIVIGGVMQIQPVNARANKLLNGKKAAALTGQTITFGAIATQTFGNADVTVTATASSGLAVTLTSSNTNVATIIAGKIHITGVGTSVITASQPGDGLTYAAAANVTQTITVNIGAKAVLSALPAATIAFQSADVTLPAVSTFAPATYANNPITYTSSNTNVATIVNGRLHLIATGTTTITASQAGNGNFADAAPITATYTINPPAAPVFTTNLAGKVMGTLDFDPAATVGVYYATITYSSSNLAVASIVNNKIHLVAPGSANITAILTYPVSTGGTATVTTTNTTLTVVAATAGTTTTPVLTLAALGTKALTDVDFVPTITTTSPLSAPITLVSSNTAVATIVNGNIHFISQGTTNITASQGGGTTGGNGLPPDTAPIALTVGAPTLGITAITGKVTNSADFTPAVTTSLTNTPVVFSVVPSSTVIATVSNGIIHLTGIAGSVTIKASQQNNTNASVILPATATLPADVQSTFTVGAATVPAITFAALGTKQFSPVEVAAGATSTLATPVVTYTSSNPAVAFITANAVASITPGPFGYGYIPGTYLNVALTGGTGSGAQANIIVTPGGQALASLTNPGKGYSAGDILSIAPASINSPGGTGFTVTVAAVSNNNIHFVAAPAAPNNTTVITATQGGGLNGTTVLPADVQQALTVTPLSINFPAIGTKAYTTQDYNTSISTNAGTATTVPYRFVYLTSNNPAVATITGTQAYTLTSGGSLYTNGTYTNVPLYGGTGTGMLATIVVASGSVTTASVITNPGINYSNLDVMTVTSSSIGGTGSGLTITLGAYTGLIHYNSIVPAAPNNTATITASMGGGANGTATLAADVSQVLTLTNPVITFPPLGTKVFTSVDINPGATGALTGLPVTYTSSNPAVATIVNGFIHFTGAPAAPNNTTIITASQVAPTGVNSTVTPPASVQQTLTVTPAVITFPAIGTRTIGPDFNPGATSSITNTPIVYTSSNPAVATINTNGINTSTITLGTLYTKGGTYVNVPLTGGTGTGALATVLVSPFGQSAGFVTSSGTGYTVGDILTITPASVGSTAGSGFAITVTSVSNMVHYTGAPAAPNNTTVITASQSGGATGTLTLPADVAQTLTVNPAIITFPLLGTKQLTSTDLPLTATSTLNGTPITYTTSGNTGIVSIVTGAITTLATPTIGIGYTDGVYTVNLAGGTGTGAQATVTIVGGFATSAVLTSSTTGYTVGDILTAPAGSLGTTGSGFNVTITGTGSAIHYLTAPASPNNTVTIIASQGGGATGTLTLPADVSQVLTVTPATISFAALGTKTYPANDILLNATSSLNKTITYTSSNTAVATINVVAGSGTYLHLVAAPAAPNNTAIITASQGGGATGTTALPADVSQTLTVTQLPLSFTFPAFGTRVLTNVDIAPGATSPLAGIPITYSSSNTAVATIVNNKVHMVSVGTAVITVSQGGGTAGTLTIPPDATQTITITAPTLTFPPLGSKPYTSVDFTPGATSSITNIPVTYTSSNPAVATFYTTLLLGTPIGGSGYKAGTYTNVPLTGGTGSGALATIVVQNGSVISVTPTAIGTLYTPGDVLSCQALSIGGVGNGFNVTVTSYYTLLHLNPAIPASPNNTTTITASLGGGASGTNSLPPDVSQTLTVVAPVITFPTIGTRTYSPVDFNPGATSSVPSQTVSYTSSNAAVATIVNALSTGTVTGGSSYTNGTYNNVVLTGGSGTGAQAKVVVAGGAVTSVSITAPGKLYSIGDVLTAPAASIGGTGTGFTVPVANFSSMVHLTNPTPASPNNTSNITASVAGSTSAYALPADVTQVLTVTATNYVFAALGSKQFTTTDLDLTTLITSTVSAPGAITFTSSNPAIASIVNNKLHYVSVNAAANTTITATQNGVVIGTSLLTAVTAPTITFAALGSKPLSSTDLAPGATSSLTSLPITYTSSNTAVATIVNGNIHYVGVGNATITASQTAAATAAGLPVPTNVTSALTVTAPTITFAALGSKPYSVTDLALTATSPLTTIPVTYTSSDPNVATIVNGNIHYVGLGTTSITATQSAAAIAAGLPVPPDVIQSLTVTAPTLTLAALGTTKPWNSTDLALTTTATYTSTIGNVTPVTLTSSDPSVVTIVYNAGIPAIHYVGIGTCSITASQPGFGNIPAPANTSQLFTVTPATIAIAAVGTKTTASVDVSPAITVTLAITSVPLSYATSDPTVATFTNGILHIVGVGTCTITASQLTSANYAPIPATATVVVTAAVTTTPVLSFTTPLGIKQFTNGTDITPTVTASLTTVPVTYTSSNPLVATIVSGNIHLSPPAIINGVAIYPNPNTTVITASQGGGPNGVTGSLPADVSQVLTVTPASITFPPLGTQRLGSVDLNPGATSTYTLLAADNTALPINYTSSDPTVATITANAINSISATATGSGYTAGTYTNVTLTGGSGSGAQATITVSSLGQAIATLTNAGKGYNAGDVLTFAPTTGGGAGFTMTVGSISTSMIHLVGTGSTVITASQGNIIVADVSQTLVVIPGGITFPSTATRSFSTVDVPPGATSTNTTAPITYTSSDVTVATITNTAINTFSNASPGSGYTAGVYNNIPLTGGAGSGAQATITVTAGGQATATITNPGKNYSVGDVLTFSPASLGTTPASGGSAFSVTVGSVNPAVLHIVGVGVTTITAMQTFGSPATTISATQILTVTAPALTFATARTAPYTLVDQDPGATSAITTVPITYTSSNPALVSIVNNKLHFNIVNQTAGYDNTAIITASQAPIAGGNYPTLTASQTLTVSQAIIVPATITKYYGDPDFSPAVSNLGYTVAYASATVATATAVNGGTAIHILAPGTSVITASQPGDSNTGAATNVTTTLTVAPAPLIITPKSITRLYGVENPIQYPLTYTGFKSATGTAPLDDSTKFTVQPLLTSVTSATAPTVNILAANGGFIPKTLPVGVYTLTYSGAASTLYTFQYGTGTLTITPAPQTLTFDQTAITKKFGDADFDALARSTGDPVVYSSSDTTIATIKNGKIHIKGIGVVTLTASISPTSGNYTGSSSLSVQLTVVSGGQTITASSPPFLVKGTNYVLNATASSGLTVQAVIADPSIATVSGLTITPLHIGTTIVTLKQPGNGFYSAAADVVLFLKVIDPSGSAVEAHLAVSPNGDGINDFLLIEGVQDYPGNHVSIINRNGIKVYNTTNYDNKGNVFAGKSNSGDQLPAGTYYYLVDYSVGDTKNHITGYFVLKY